MTLAKPIRTASNENPVPTIKNTFQKESQDNVDKITVKYPSNDALLKAFAEVMHANDIRLAPIYGTALGLYRDQKQILGDTDADLGFYEQDMLKLKGLVPELLEKGFYISGFNNFQLTFRNPFQEFFIDLWIVRKVRNPFLRLLGYKWLKDHVYFRENFFGDCTTVDYQGAKYEQLNRIEEYLEKVYGPDWRIPMSGVFCGPRGLISQWVNWPFVDFSVPLQYSGDNRMGKWRPWASKVLKAVAPNADISKTFEHPE